MKGSRLSFAGRIQLMLKGAAKRQWRRGEARRTFLDSLQHLWEEAMKRLALALLLSSFAIGGALADPTCHDRAAEKKLAGAALTSFMKKCESDAATTCDTQAADKKLSGAAKTSFTKKCVKDATGA
jgi:hypothetical protein